jgi:hypothetical protein
MPNRSKKSEVECISAYPRPGLPHVQSFHAPRLAKNVPKVEATFFLKFYEEKESYYDFINFLTSL